MSKNVPTSSSSSMAFGCPQQVSQHSWVITECGFCLDVSKPKHRYLMYIYPLGRKVVPMSLMLVILPWTLGDFEPTTIWHHHHGQLWTMPDFIRMIKTLWHNPIELLVVLVRGLLFLFPWIWFCRIKVKNLHKTRIESIVISSMI